MTEKTSSEVIVILKKITGRRIPVSEINSYAASLNMIPENRRNNLGGARTYYWSDKDIEKLITIIKEQ